MLKVNVAVIFGGKSVEYEIAIITAIQVMHALNAEKYNVVPIYISKTGDWYLGNQLFTAEDFKDIPRLLSNCIKIAVSPNATDHRIYTFSVGFFGRKILERIDIAFPVFHGSNGEDGAMQGFFRLMDIPYVGCDVLSSAVTMDKIMTKMILRTANISVLDDVWFYKYEWQKDPLKILSKIETQFQYPMIVKPANLGSSVGVTAVSNKKELSEAIELATALSRRILIEPKIEKLMEINCAVLGDHENVEASVCEKPLSNDQILSFKDKYLNKESGTKGMSGAKRELPADIPKTMSQTIQELAKKTFITLDCAGNVRIDFMIDQTNNKLYVNELNTIPGSLAFYLWEASGKSFTQLTDQLIEIALKRHRQLKNLTFSYESNVLSGFGGTKGKLGCLKTPAKTEEKEKND